MDKPITYMGVYTGCTFHHILPSNKKMSSATLIVTKIYTPNTTKLYVTIRELQFNDTLNSEIDLQPNDYKYMKQ